VPISKAELLDTITALLARRRMPITSHSVCVECKQAGNPCVLVAHGTACLGPVTHGGCNALCPSFDRGCFGCFGPSESANLTAMHAAVQQVGTDTPGLVRLLRTFNTSAPEFQLAADRLEGEDHPP
jgi:sulfhydrogenase subunit delta